MAKLPVKTRFYYLFPLVILLLTALVYWPSLDNQLTNWDDDEYITENKNLGDGSFRKHFKEVPHVMGNYHPLSMWTLAWDYQSAYNEQTKTLDPVPFHRTNLILHLLSTVLVFFLFFKLSENNWIAGFTAALFALHPMHVESVAWAAERKDVLFAFFYLAGLLSWIFFIERKNNYVFYLLTFGLFLLSLFSKAVAVSLPILLLALDYYYKRPMHYRLLLEKLPFLAVSVYFGLEAIEAQKEFEAIQGNVLYDHADRLLFACYGTMQYVLKFILPSDLSCFYSFPVPGVDKPGLYSIAPVFVLGIGAALWTFRKSRFVLFGAAFFFITVGLVLQLLPVGGAVMADRYSYLPHIGLAFILAKSAWYLVEKKPRLKHAVLGTLIAFTLLMAFQARKRTEVWKDSVTLWADAEQHDKMSPKLYNNYADALTLAGDHQRGLEMYNKALSLKPDYAEAFYNRGLAYFYLKNYQAALNDYDAAIHYNPTLAVAWHNRAGTHFTVGRYREALGDALKAKELGYPVDPQFITVLEEEVKKLPR
ncbi:MAG: tetratricopeptide repeat protein [Bacteroidia bacterium]|nr:tetratricopeptide repeat protein [Bacteroidia bacterium]